MRELRLVAVSDDGGKLLLRGDAQDPEYTVRIDERLHAAIRGDRPRLGQLEIQLDSQLRPRDIQARVRSGQSAEALAEASGLPLERVMRYAGPVIAEREHMADRARRSVVRRGGDGPVVLDDAVSGQLEARGIAGEELEWDAWRGEDGRWSVRTGFADLDGEQRQSTWVFDPAGRSVTAQDDFSRWLSGEQDYPAPPTPEPVATRLAVVPSFAQPAGEALPGGWPELAAGRPAPEDLRTSMARGQVDRADDRAARSAAGTAPDTAPDTDDEIAGQTHITVEIETVQIEQLQPASARADVPAAPASGHGARTRDGRRDNRSVAGRARPARAQADTGRLRLSDIAQHVDEGPAADPAAESPAGAGTARKPRASVPSWDEIMFGKRRRGE